MLIALEDAGLPCAAGYPLEVRFRGKVVGNFIPDILVDGRVVLELKACEKLKSEHEAQALNYLRATPLGVGLLLNFGSKPQVKRLAFENSRKTGTITTN